MKLSFTLLAASMATMASAQSTPEFMMTSMNQGDDLASTIAMGKDVKISNVVTKGDPSCFGYFQQTTSVDMTNFMASGIVLSTGKATDLIGPNDVEDKTTQHDTPGDGDLQLLVGGLQTHDACVLEFDFECEGFKMPMVDVMFQYSFSSEEYLEYVDKGFNDVFGFFLNGVNIGVLPNGDPVTIDTVNSEDNSGLFVDNAGGGASLNALQPDGYTKPLEAKGMGKKDSKNRIKLAIADVGDKILDSWVVIEEGSFQCVDPETSGDPHVSTWGNEMFDYMGACDLVLVHTPEFANGKGLDIHVRTKIQSWWSHIDQVAIKIGDDILEMHGGSEDTWFWVNGKPNEGKMKEGKIFKTEIGGFVTRIQQKNDKIRKIVINLGENNESIVIKSFNEIVRVDVNPGVFDHWQGTVGLMGAFPKGHLLGRDGKTIFSDTDAFGQEWQVTAEEPSLFHQAEGAQAPEMCSMPTEARPKRRLGEASQLRKTAETACAGVPDAQWREACIADVVATGDIESAGVYAEDTPGAF